MPCWPQKFPTTWLQSQASGAWSARSLGFEPGRCASRSDPNPVFSSPSQRDEAAGASHPRGAPGQARVPSPIIAQTIPAQGPGRSTVTAFGFAVRLPLVRRLPTRWDSSSTKPSSERQTFAPLETPLPTSWFAPSRLTTPPCMGSTSCPAHASPSRSRFHPVPPCGSERCRFHQRLPTPPQNETADRPDRTDRR